MKTSNKKYVSMFNYLYEFVTTNGERKENTTELGNVIVLNMDELYIKIEDDVIAIRLWRNADVDSSGNINMLYTLHFTGKDEVKSI